MTGKYPRMLYRDGSQCRVWNAHDVDTLIVADADEEAKAKAEGWRESPIPPHPLDHDLDGKPGGSLPRRGRNSKSREALNERAG